MMMIMMAFQFSYICGWLRQEKEEFSQFHYVNKNNMSSPLSFTKFRGFLYMQSHSEWADGFIKTYSI